MAVYKVETPTGVKYVEASTNSQAIKHFMDADYKATSLNSDETAAVFRSGATVEQVAAKPAKPETAAEGEAKPDTAGTAGAAGGA